MLLITCSRSFICSFTYELFIDACCMPDTPQGLRHTAMKTDLFFLRRSFHSRRKHMVNGRGRFYLVINYIRKRQKVCQRQWWGWSCSWSGSRKAILRHWSEIWIGGKKQWCIRFKGGVQSSSGSKNSSSSKVRMTEKRSERDWNAENGGWEYQNMRSKISKGLDYIEELWVLLWVKWEVMEGY